MKTRFRFPISVALRSLVALALLSLAGRALAQPAHEPSAAPESPPAVPDLGVATVHVDGHPLFRVRGAVGTNAKERARDIGSRISQAAADRTFSPDSLFVSETPFGTQILADDAPLIMVSDADARIERMTRPQVAARDLARIRDAIATYRNERSAKSLLNAALMALAATAALLIALALLIWARRHFESLVQKRFEKGVSALKPEQAALARTDQVWKTLGMFLRAAGWLAGLIVVVVYAQIVLGLFPWTRSAGNHLLGYLTDPLRVIVWGAIGFIPNLIFLFVLAIVTRLVLRALSLVAEGLQRETIQLKGFDRDWAWPTYRIVRVVVIGFAIVVAYPAIPGSNTEAFKGVSIFFGVLISLGSTSVVGNLLSGYTMIYRRAFRVGDRVQIEGMVGEVTEIRVMVTHLRTPKNEEVVIPNSTIINASVTNFSALARKRGLILHTTVGVGYEVPWRQVEAMLLMAAGKTGRVLHEPKPFVLQRRLGDFAVEYELNVYTDDATVMLNTYDELHRNVLDAFNEYGVQIMTPAYEDDPETAKVVPKAKWYAAPAAPPGGASER
jgi:small-conductance mechanosensitive channel